MTTDTGTTHLDPPLITLANRLCEAAGIDLADTLDALTTGQPMTGMPTALRAGWDAADLTIDTDQHDDEEPNP